MFMETDVLLIIQRSVFPSQFSNFKSNFKSKLKVCFGPCLPLRYTIRHPSRDVKIDSWMYESGTPD